MKVSAKESFQIVYSLYQHEYLGYLFESFVVKLDDAGKLTLQHQNISSLNAPEFSEGLDEDDFELIELMDSIQQDTVAHRFSDNGFKPADFFLKIFDEEKGNKFLQEEISRFLEKTRARILSLLAGKRLFEMGSDGEPTWKELKVMPKKAKILFHFRKNEGNTHYFPTIKYDGQKLDFQYRGAYILCKEPAWLVVDSRVYSFEKDIDGSKLLPFLNKKFIVIPEKLEGTYYKKFIVPLVAMYDVYAKGFEIQTERHDPKPELHFHPLQTQALTESLFDEYEGEVQPEKLVIELKFQYGQFYTKPSGNRVEVELEHCSEGYIFHRIERNVDQEKKIVEELFSRDLVLKHGRVSMSAGDAMAWFHAHKQWLESEGIAVRQSNSTGKRYYLGESNISLEIKEGIDWFDINASVTFGKYFISFKELRSLMAKGLNEIELPNGETAVIPNEWFEDYADLFNFITQDSSSGGKLAKHHLALVQDLEKGEWSKITMDRKLQKLKDFSSIDPYQVPSAFQGTLRPYQHAGYNWLRFLNDYKFGGCLADDMGLGKTIQALALLQHEHEVKPGQTNFLIMPTSLVYNWQKEAMRFTPTLKIYVYSGTNRNKDVSLFNGHDLVITSYGIVRRDIDTLSEYYFNYVILDESQAIKNPRSNISKAVRKLSSRHRLILTGTPLENSTMDLWSQISFINPGLLGSKGFFKKHFQRPIEKNGDEGKMKRLNLMIKPFILRRHKSQVARELPEKIENVYFSSMSEDQQTLYDQVKNQYRNKILDHIEAHGQGRSQMLLLQGLTQLRQIANHPALVEPEYTGESGKLQDMEEMMNNALAEDHKMLIFSQFVKHLKIIRSRLDKHQISYAYLDGSTRNREEEVERFQNDDSVHIFLISLKAGGLGLNLTKADYVFLMDPWWNPATEAQAIDRAHRIGQDKKVFTYKFITKNSVEEKILELQQRKKKLASELITVDQSFVKSLSQKDIKILFE